MMKLRWGHLAAVGGALCAGYAAAVIQTGTPAPSSATTRSGGAVHRVDRIRPTGIHLIKRKAGSRVLPLATRVPVLPPILDVPAARIQASIPAADPCGCPVTAATPGGVPGTTPDPNAARLVQDLCAEIAQHQTWESREGLEAGVAYRLDQSGAPRDVQLSALSTLAGYRCAPANLPVALAGVRNALDRPGGTGGIGRGSFGDFPGPEIAQGGGSANYSF